MAIHACLNILISYGQAIDETAALVAHIEGANSLDTQLLLQLTAAAREIVIRAQGGKDNEVNIPRGEPGLLQGSQRSLQAKVRRPYPFLHKTTLADTGSLLNPFIRSLHELFQVCVGDNSFGKITSGSKDF